MGDDSFDRPDRPSPPAAAAHSGTCAIARARGDVTTARAAAAVRARADARDGAACAESGRASGRASVRAEAAPPELFPAHLLRVGPA